MTVWEEYRRLEGDRRWRNGYGDEVWVQNMLYSDKKVVLSDEQYHTRYRPAQSDIVTTVPNGRFGTCEEAVEYAVEVVMRGDTIRKLEP